jgi:dTMP kinase
MQGFFITMEGIDGTGKTTQLNRLVQKFRELGREVIVVKEPGDKVDGKYVGSEIGAQIRNMIFFDPTSHVLHKDVTDLLFLADHMQLWTCTIEPAIAAGKVVICDRYADSQFAYGVAKGSSDWIQSLYVAQYGPTPEVTVLLLGDPEFLLPRTKRAGTTEAGKQDGKVWAGIDSQNMVRSAYLHQLAPQKRTITVHVTEGKTIDCVADEIWSKVKVKYDRIMRGEEIPEQFELFPDGVKAVSESA